MKRWFTGHFAGHYRGTRKKASSMSPYRDAEHFSIEVYEAIVTDVKLGPLVGVPSEHGSGAEFAVPAPGDGAAEMGANPSAPFAPSAEDRQSHHHTPTGHQMHQTHIGQAHLVGAVRAGQTVRTTVHDALMSGLTFSHGVRERGSSFGRVEGTLSGWFRPPPEPSPPAEIPAPPVSGPAPVGWASDVVVTPSPRAGKGRSQGSVRTDAKSRHTPMPEREKISFPPPNRSLTKPGVAPPPSSGVLPPAPKLPNVAGDLAAAEQPAPVTEKKTDAPPPEVEGPSVSQSSNAKIPVQPEGGLYEFAHAHEELDEDNDVRIMRAYRPGEEPSAGTSERRGEPGPPWPLSEDESADDGEDEDLGEEEEEDEEALETEAESRLPVREYPFFTLGLVALVLLGFFARPLAAVVFGTTYLLAATARKWLVGVVPDGGFIRFLSLVISVGQVLLGALLVARWSGAGCVSLSPMPLMMLLAGQMVSSLFPRPLTFALTSGTFAAVLLQAYAAWAPPLCG